MSRQRQRLRPRRPARAGGWVAVLLLFALLPSASRGASAASDPPLAAVPQPSLEGMSPSVAGRLTELRQTLDELTGSEAPATEELAAAYGELGQAYFSAYLSEAAEAALTNAARLAPQQFRWPYLLGVLYQRDRRLAEAAEALAAALAIEPGYLPAVLRLAEIRRLESDHDAARRLFERALSIDRSSAAAYRGLGLLAASEEQLDSAVAQLETALSLAPEASSLHQPLGLAYRDLGELDKARQHLAQAGQEEVEIPDPVLARLSQAATQTPHWKALAARREGDLDTALAEHAKAVAEEPDNVTYRLAYSGSLALAERYDDAIAQLEELLRRNPSHAVGHYRLGRMLILRQAKVERGMAELRRAVELAPELAPAVKMLAAMEARRGDFAAAAGHYARAVELAPDDTGLRLLWVETLRLAGQNERAQTALGELLESEAKPQIRAGALLQAGTLAEARGDDDGAAERYRQAAQLAPGLLDAHLSLGAVLGRLGRYSEAAAALQRAVELAPANPGPRLALAAAWRSAGQPQRAREVLEAGLADGGEGDAGRQLRLALARLLATAADPEVADGERALALAGAALEARPTVEATEVACMALAAAGRFDEAVQWQERLLSQVDGEEVPAELLERLRRNLSRYRAGQLAEP